mmetsp:Transcript_51920/g.118385  ORF Transcript_51920/g.118385 Transcript_51920/m.118385 type:complete len:355 (-) Transcript_51920:2730-3794(-)
MSRARGVTSAAAPASYPTRAVSRSSASSVPLRLSPGARVGVGRRAAALRASSCWARRLTMPMVHTSAGGRFGAGGVAARGSGRPRIRHRSASCARATQGGRENSSEAVSPRRSVGIAAHGSTGLPLRSRRQLCERMSRGRPPSSPPRFGVADSSCVAGRDDDSGVGTDKRDNPPDSTCGAAVSPGATRPDPVGLELASAAWGVETPNEAASLRATGVATSLLAAGVTGSLVTPRAAAPPPSLDTSSCWGVSGGLSPSRVLLPSLRRRSPVGSGRCAPATGAASDAARDPAGPTDTGWSALAGCPASSASSPCCHASSLCPAPSPCPASSPCATSLPCSAAASGVTPSCSSWTSS